MLRVLRVEVLEQVPQELRCTPGHDQRDADSCGGVLGFGEKFAVDHDCGSFFSHFVLALFFVYVHNIHKLLTIIKRLDKDFSYFFAYFLKKSFFSFFANFLQKVGKFGLK